MEGKTNDKIENSEKINNEICDPATQEKKLIELSPGNPESNKMKKIKNKKLNTILKKNPVFILVLIKIKIKKV